MEYVTVIGLFAAFLTTLSLLPQVIKLWKTKSAQDAPIITANALVFVQAMAILMFKRRFSRINSRRVPLWLGNI